MSGSCVKQGVHTQERALVAIPAAALLVGELLSRRQSTAVSSECVNHRFINPQSIYACALIHNSNPKYCFIP